MTAAEKAVAYARDILGADVKAVWGPDWPYEMAEGVLELKQQLDALTQPDFWRPTGKCPEC